MVYVTSIHLVGGAGHEHIAEVKWSNPGDGATGATSREKMVEFIRGGGAAKVTDGKNIVDVRVVEVNPPYIRSQADGKWTDNLLALPKY